MAKSPTLAVKKTPSKAVKKDNYARYVAIMIVTLLAFFLALYAYTHSKEKIKNIDNYQALPQVVIQSNEQVVRLQMTIQVNENDQDWLKKNKSTINEIFKNTVNEIDPLTFRSNAGRVAVQEKLRDEINRQMAVRKVVDVLYSDMVIQTKDGQ